MSLPMMLHLNFPEKNINKIMYSGYIEITEEITGEIELVLEVNKCDLEIKACEKYNSLKIGGMCQKFKDKNAFYSSGLSTIKPPLKCPIKPGNYSMENSAIDLSLVSVFPLDNFAWIVIFKFVAADSNKSKKTVMCINSETKIFKTRKIQ